MNEVTLDDILEALAGVSEAFAEAPADSGSIYTPPPDGEYQALIHLFEFMGGDWGIALKVSYQITNDAQYAGKITSDMFGFSPERIKWLKSFLARLDVNTEAVDPTVDLRPGSNLLNSLLDTPVLIKIKRSMRDGTEYVNTYLQRKLGEPGSNAMGFTPATSDVTSSQDGFDFAPAGRHAGADDDDIPF